MKKILLGVTGSISAYKSADITNQLVKLGYQVDVIMTESSTHFIATYVTIFIKTCRPYRCHARKRTFSD